MNKIKIFMIILIILNFMVLFGQIWPEGAPPFAKIVNISTLIINIVFLVSLIFLKKLNQ